MKVVITDRSFDDITLERAILESAGCTVEDPRSKDPAVLAAAVADADAVITQFAPINADVIGAMRKAKAIVRYGIGYDNVDVEAARARGIPVCNIPDYCIDEVSDHTLAFILALTRQVVPHSQKIHGGGWGLASAVEGFRTLASMTCGVVGCGRIGRGVVRRLVGFGGRVLVSDPLTPESEIRSLGAEPVSLVRILGESDLITLHCPSLPQTRGLIGTKNLATMKRGVLIVNLSRGDLVDPAALVAALDSGQVGGAALDVFSPEPIPAGHPILGRANVILAPHIASVSPAAVLRLRTGAAELAVMALRGEALPSVVNGVGRTPGA
ncbi:MAG: C-terminal binding protein [Planctomycetota bacterium]|nr:MAG: C-terminal binding protein [Planctomycetota bacterium]